MIVSYERSLKPDTRSRGISAVERRERDSMLNVVVIIAVIAVVVYAINSIRREFKRK